jgi:hypothetical protein
MISPRRVVDDGTGRAWFVLDGIQQGTLLERAAREMEFSEYDDGFGRSFAQSSLFLEEAYSGFARLGPAMLEQQVDPGLKPWEDALDEAITRAESAGVSLFLVGSAALAVQGAAVAPSDIDFVVTDDGARQLGEVLIDVLVEPVSPTPGWISRWFGRAFVCDCRVEWAGGVEPHVDDPTPADFGPTALERAIELDWRGHTLRVPPLDLLRDVNDRRDRPDRVAAIDALIG